MEKLYNFTFCREAILKRFYSRNANRFVVVHKNSSAFLADEQLITQSLCNALNE